jgi:hypothetical protein
MIPLPTNKHLRVVSAKIMPGGEIGVMSGLISLPSGVHLKVNNS